jgi:hypothetical protein
MPGVSVAGNVRPLSVNRVASAIGEGVIAIQLLHQYPQALTAAVDIIMVMRKHSCRINPVLNVAFISDMKILAGHETVGLHSWYGRVFRRPETGSLEAVKAA